MCVCLVAHARKHKHTQFVQMLKSIECNTPNEIVVIVESTPRSLLVVALSLSFCLFTSLSLARICDQFMYEKANQNKTDTKSFIGTQRFKFAYLILFPAFILLSLLFLLLYEHFRKCSHVNRSYIFFNQFRIENT